jgi:exodeoxyribonuclease III
VTLKLLSYNIRYGGHGREDAIGAVIAAAAPDVVVFQEATDPAVVARIASAARLEVWGARPGQSLGFASRVPPASVAWHWPPSSRHAWLALAPAGSELQVIGVHLSAIHAAWAERRRVRELGALLAAIDALRDRPHVLMGDFNSLAPGAALDIRRLPPRLRPFVWLSGGRIRWQVVAMLLEAGYVDVAAACGAADTPTFPTWGSHLRLDYAFVPRAWTGMVRSYHVVTSPADVRRASDHHPIAVQVQPPAESIKTSA